MNTLIRNAGVAAAVVKKVVKEERNITREEFIDILTGLEEILGNFEREKFINIRQLYTYDNEFRNVLESVHFYMRWKNENRHKIEKDGIMSSFQGYVGYIDGISVNDFMRYKGERKKVNLIILHNGVVAAVVRKAVQENRYITREEFEEILRELERE